MTCDPYRLVEYVCGGLDLDKIEELTTHLEQCEQCSQQLQVLARLRANREELRARLLNETAKETHPAFPFPNTPVAKSPYFPGKTYAWALAALLILAFGIILLVFRSHPAVVDIATLATAGKPHYEPLVFRNGAEASAAFAAAMEEYRKDRLPSARAQLEKYLKAFPEDSEALFYLGSILYLQQEYPAAAQSIQAGLERCVICSREKFHWYLAQIALKSRQKEEARKELRQVVELHGTYAEEALQILQRL